jgi:hypothetical protein
MFLKHLFLWNIHNDNVIKILTTGPKNITPWRDSNPGLLFLEEDAMSTALRCQGMPK